MPYLHFLRAVPLALLVSSIHCQAWQPPSGLAPSEEPESEPLATVHTLPALADGEVTPVTEWVIAAGGELDPAAVYLFSGEVGSRHWSRLVEGDMAESLAERELATVTWFSSDGRLHLRPQAALEEGARYHLAAPSLGVDKRYRVADGPPVLEHMFPPSAAAAVGQPRWGVWCGDSSLGSTEAAPIGSWSVGTGPAGSGPSHCIRWDGGFGAAPSVSPLGDLRAPWLLEPRPYPPSREGTPEASARLTCDGEEVGVGPGCLRRIGDRLVVRAPESPHLWSLSATGDFELVWTTRGRHPRTVGPLTDSGSMRLTVDVDDIWGRHETREVQVGQSAPLPHVIMTEVLADALGPEPEHEWIELHNRGSIAADLEGYRLQDLTGEIVLPSYVLEPGAFVVLAHEDHATFSLPPWTPDTPLLVLPEVAPHGLSNQGEPLSLLDPDGIVTSRFMPPLKPKAGHSIHRLDPFSADDAPRAYLRTEHLTPGYAAPEPE
ncbi:MAG: lamin tail domain-containing protein [Myxococcota bacterium]